MKINRWSDGRFKSTYAHELGDKMALALAVGITLVAIISYIIGQHHPIDQAHAFLDPQPKQPLVRHTIFELPSITIAPTATPTPRPTVYVPNTPDQQEIKDIIAEVFGDKADQALKVGMCESGLRSVCNDGLNRDGSVDCGALQINLKAHNQSRENMLDPRKNIAYAKKLYDRSGWQPWYSSKKCHGL